MCDSVLKLGLINLKRKKSNIKSTSKDLEEVLEKDENYSKITHSEIQDEVINLCKTIWDENKWKREDLLKFPSDERFEIDGDNKIANKIREDHKDQINKFPGKYCSL